MEVFFSKTLEWSFLKMGSIYRFFLEIKLLLTHRPLIIYDTANVL